MKKSESALPSLCLMLGKAILKSEDYINIFQRGFGGAVKTGLEKDVKSAGLPGLARPDHPPLARETTLAHNIPRTR